jgi:hypothetical protein
MDFFIRQDIQRLVTDSNDLQMVIKELVRDSEAWARDRESQDLAEFAENLKQLECDVILLQADWVTIMGEIYQGCGQYDIFEGFQGAFDSLNTLFSDLKKMRAELNECNIRKGEIRALEIDWARFKKMVERFRQSLCEVDAHVKKGCASLPGKENKNGRFSTNNS